MIYRIFKKSYFDNSFKKSGKIESGQKKSGKIERVSEQSAVVAVGKLFGFFSQSLTASQKNSKHYIQLIWTNFAKVTEKNHKRSLNQKVALFIFIFEYFTNTLLYFFNVLKMHFKIILSLCITIFIYFPILIKHLYININIYINYN